MMKKFLLTLACVGFIATAHASTISNQPYGTSTALTINATAWAQAVTISATAVQVNTSPFALDYQCTFKWTFPNSAPANQKQINVYVSPSEDGTNYAENDQYSGTQNSQTTLRSPTNFYYATSFPVTQNVAGTGVIPSIRAVLGGSTMPRDFGLIFENQGGQTITSPTGTCTAINYTVQ